MIVWGGFDGTVHVNTGARYKPSTNTWTATNLSNAPSARIGHAAVWTGHEMIVWGGYNYQENLLLDTGGRYSPTTDSWIPTTMTKAPWPPPGFPDRSLDWRSDDNMGWPLAILQSGWS